MTSSDGLGVAALVAALLLLVGCIKSPPSNQPRNNEDPRRSDSSSVSEGPFSAAQESGLQPESETIADLLFEQSNQARLEAMLPALKRSVVLDRLAKEHSQKMAQRDRAPSHDGFEKRAQRAEEQLSSRSLAENVASSRGHQDPATVAVEGWLGSDGHRRNLLGSYQRTGVGVAISRSGQVFSTQLFTD